MTITSEKYDPYKMFNHGCAFSDISDLCKKEPTPFKDRTNFHTIAGLVNSAFACEIFMKTILVIKGKTDNLRGHNIYNLWKKIEFEDLELSIQIKDEIVKIYNSNSKELFDNILKVCEKSFEQLRYVYELNSIQIDPYFLIILRSVLKNKCSQLLDEYN